MRKLLKESEEDLRSQLNLMVKVTLELQDRLRTMFLPTAERCHYVFSTRDLRVIFRLVIVHGSLLMFMFPTKAIWYEADFVAISTATYEVEPLLTK